MSSCAAWIRSDVDGWVESGDGLYGTAKVVAEAGSLIAAFDVKSTTSKFAREPTENGSALFSLAINWVADVGGDESG
jgi:hypothetical protein